MEARQTFSCWWLACGAEHAHVLGICLEHESKNLLKKTHFAWAPLPHGGSFVDTHIQAPQEHAIGLQLPMCSPGLAAGADTLRKFCAIHPSLGVTWCLRSKAQCLMLPQLASLPSREFFLGRQVWLPPHRFLLDHLVAS